METAQPLHQESKALVDYVAKLNFKPFYELETVEEARARIKMIGINAAVMGDVKYDGIRKELFVPLPDFTGKTNTFRPDTGQECMEGGGARGACPLPRTFPC